MSWVLVRPESAEVINFLYSTFPLGSDASLEDILSDQSDETYIRLAEDEVEDALDTGYVDQSYAAGVLAGVTEFKIVFRWRSESTHTALSPVFGNEFYASYEDTLMIYGYAGDIGSEWVSTTVYSTGAVETVGSSVNIPADTSDWEGITGASYATTAEACAALMAHPDQIFQLTTYPSTIFTVEDGESYVPIYHIAAIELWIGGEVESVTVVRQYPRDDQYGLGSAPRLHSTPMRSRIHGGIQ